MKTLFVLRHAKSSWDNPDWSDFERPLNSRGLDAARFIGELIYTTRFAAANHRQLARQTRQTNRRFGQGSSPEFPNR